MSRVPFTAASVERALDHHKAAGRIRGWEHTIATRYRVELAHGSPVPDLELRSLREAFVFVSALASADHSTRLTIDIRQGWG